MNGINQIRDKCATFRLLDKLMVEFLLGGLMPCVSSVLAVAEVQFSNLLILKLFVPSSSLLLSLNNYQK